MTTALQHRQARAILADGSRSFGFAAHFLPADQWDDAARIYAFCRLVDDVADDESVAAHLRLAELDLIRAGVQRRVAACPTVQALLEVDDRRGLDLEAAVALIDGCAEDVGVVRISDDGALLRYSYRVASTVGLLMCGVLGVRDRRALPFAIDLGIAMQLTNICRDVLEDAAMGRVYLPSTRLRAAGIHPEDLVHGTARSDRVGEVVLDVLGLAERYYRSAWRGMHYLPLRARLAIVVAARVYRRIGLDLAARKGDALAGRTVVPLAGKLVEAARAVVQFFSPTVLGWNAPARHDTHLHAALEGLPGANTERDLSHVLLDQDRRRDDRHPEEHPHRLGAEVWIRPAPAD